MATTRVKHTYSLPIDLHERLKERADAERRNLSETFAMALEYYFDNVPMVVPLNPKKKTERKR